MLDRFSGFLSYSFNRTIVELKAAKQGRMRWHTPSFNRTIVELKEAVSPSVASTADF